MNVDLTRPVFGYHVGGEHRQGSFGVVHGGHGPNGERVAIKFLKNGESASADEIAALDFARDSKHPNLVDVVAHGPIDGGYAIVMEWADESLQDRLDLARVDGTTVAPEDAVRWVTDVADGLDHLASHRIAHHDVKPANVLLVGGRAKLTDFGFATRVERSVAATPFLGTPQFTAPEMFRGDTALRRTDQYSLAVMYYWLRSGRPPYREMLGDGLTPELVMQIHLNAAPELEGLAAGERAAVEKALAKNPRDRFPTCSAFAEEVRRTAPASRPEPPIPAETWAAQYAELRQSVRGLEKENGKLRARGYALLVAGLGLLGWLVSLPVAALPEPEPPVRRDEIAELRRELLAKLAHADERLVAAQQTGLGELKSEMSLRLAEADQKLRLALKGIDYPKVFGLAKAAYLEKRFADARDLLAVCPDEERCFEHHHLLNCVAAADADRARKPGDQIRTPSFILDGHAKTIRCVAYNPAGNELASAGEDGSVRVWLPSKEKNSQLFKFEDHEKQQVDGVVFSGDGKMLATVGQDNYLRIRRADQPGGSIAASKGKLAGPVLSLAWHPKRALLASGGHQTAVFPLQLPLMEEALEPSSAYGPIGGIQPNALGFTRTAFLHKNDNWVVAVGRSSSIYFWPSARLPTPSEGPKSFDIITGLTEISGLAISPNDETVAVSGKDGVVNLYSIPARVELRKLAGHAKGATVNCVAWSPDGRRLVSTCDFGGVIVWHADSGLPLISLPTPKGAKGLSVAFRRDGRQIAVASGDSSIAIWGSP